MFCRILVPLDRSPISEQALEPAIALALASGAALDVVMVQDHALLGEMTHRVTAAQQAADEVYLQQIEQRVKHAGISEVREFLLAGGPAESIVAHAATTRADLIVMTSRFRTGLHRTWSGSVADHVMRHCGIPVLMLRAAKPGHEASQTYPGFRRILVPLDGSPAATAVLHAVRALSAGTGGEVQLLRVVQPPSPVASMLSVPGTVSQFGMAMSELDSDVIRVTTDRLVRLANEDIDETVAALAAGGMRNITGVVIKHDDVASGIVEFAAANGADLIALTTRGRGASRLLLGSVADGILRESTLPVLLEHRSDKVPEVPPFAPEEFECQLPQLLG